MIPTGYNDPEPFPISVENFSLHLLSCVHTSDIVALLVVIDSAQKFVYIAVMDYIPAIIYSDPHKLVFLTTIHSLTTTLLFYHTPAGFGLS